MSILFIRNPHWSSAEQRVRNDLLRNFAISLIATTRSEQNLITDQAACRPDRSLNTVHVGDNLLMHGRILRLIRCSFSRMRSRAWIYLTHADVITTQRNLQNSSSRWSSRFETLLSIISRTKLSILLFDRWSGISQWNQSGTKET
jgi:hypothetical protein